MLKQNERLLQLGIRWADLAVLSLAFPLAYVARDRMQSSTLPGLNPITSYWPVLAATLLMWIAVSWATRVYDSYRTRPFTTELFRLARAMALVALAMSSLGFLFRQHGVSRLFVGLYFALALVLLVSDRALLRALARSMGRGFHARRFAVVGCSEFARDVVRDIARKAKWGYEFAGYIVDAEVPGALAPTKILGSLPDLRRLLRTHVLDEVIFAMPRERLDEVEDGVALCQEQGTAARVCLDFWVRSPATMSIDDSLEVPTLMFTMTPSDAVALAAKRVFDIVFSAAVLLALAPAFVLIAIAIWVDSPGPIFFRQKRVGMNGREFWFYKFRSMYEDAERRRDELAAFNEADGPVFKIRKDPRITPVGAILRRTSLDELPQFWNVLRGEMSVVGPRPPLPSEVLNYERAQRRRISMKPGITCIWQVSGRSDLGFDRWMELDLEYIDHWSLWQDLKIVAKTVPAVLSGRGAH